MHIYESTHTPQTPNQLAAEGTGWSASKARQGEGGRRSGRKNGRHYFFKFFDRFFFAPPPELSELSELPELRDPAQKSLKNSAGDQAKSALASADFGTFSALETARICAAGGFSGDLKHLKPVKNIWNNSMIARSFEWFSLWTVNNWLSCAIVQTGDEVHEVDLTRDCAVLAIFIYWFFK